MRRTHCTPRPAAAHAPAAALLARRLPLRGYKRSVPAAARARALALLGAWACSLHALARRLGGPSHETLRRAFHAGRPTLARLDACLPALLRDALPARPPRRPVELAIDLHRRPFYGDRATPGLLGGKAERGTRSFWTYATAVALAPGRRWTVGLARVRSNRMPAVLRALWPQVEASGLRVRRRLLDGGFYCAGVVRWLQRRGVPFVLPVPRKGTAGGTRALYGRPPGLTEYSWRPKGGRRVTVRVAVVRRLLGRRRPRRRKVLVFAYGGLTDGQARRAGAVYRRRFGVDLWYRRRRLGHLRVIAERLAVRPQGVGLLAAKHDPAGRRLWHHGLGRSLAEELLRHRLGLIVLQRRGVALDVVFVRLEPIDHLLVGEAEVLRELVHALLRHRFPCLPCRGPPGGLRGPASLVCPCCYRQASQPSSRSSAGSGARPLKARAIRRPWTAFFAHSGSRHT